MLARATYITIAVLCHGDSFLPLVMSFYSYQTHYDSVHTLKIIPQNTASHLKFVVALSCTICSLDRLEVIDFEILSLNELINVSHFILSNPKNSGATTS